MAYWLLKSEPDEFSIDDLAREKVAGWDGVRNYQARNFLKAMKKGDRTLFYHSSTKPPAIVGVVRIVKGAYPDPTQFDPRSDYYDPDSPRQAPRWVRVDVKFIRKFPAGLSLGEIKRIPVLKGMVLLKRGRLSVQPVTASEWTAILAACKSMGSDP